MNTLTNLRLYAQRKGSTSAGRLSEIQCWRELARVSGVNSYPTLGRLEAMRGILSKNNLTGYGQNELGCLRLIAGVEGLDTSVYSKNEAQIMIRLATP